MAWVEDEIKTVDFGDARLDERMKNILESFASKPSFSIPQACGGWTDTFAAYRFFAKERA